MTDPDRHPDGYVRTVMERSFVGPIVHMCTRCGACVPTVADEDADGTPRKIHDAFHDLLKVSDA